MGSWILGTFRLVSVILIVIVEAISLYRYESGDKIDAIYGACAAIFLLINLYYQDLKDRIDRNKDQGASE